ncbi:MAG: hypothetical protein ACTSR8_11535 [Promethearchaeota archaeon]
MKLNSFKLRFWVLIFIISISLFNSPKNFNGKSGNPTERSNYSNSKKEPLIDKEKLYINSLNSDNTYTGIGAPWNLTHYSHRVENDSLIQLSETNDKNIDIPIGGGWIGQSSEFYLHSLYETRNWCNGTFAFGNDNGYDVSPANDSTDPRISQNSFQNWTFYARDVGSYINNMSGNYEDNVASHDSIELRMDGEWIGGSSWAYNHNDRCGWISSFPIEAGHLIDAELLFDAYVNQTLHFNDWNIRFYINDVMIYKIANYELEQACGGQKTWNSFSIPKELWSNKSNVFPSILNSSTISLNVSLEFVSGDSIHWGTLPGKEYQQFYLDNIKLITKAETKAEKIKLKLNNTSIKSKDWGEASIDLNGLWDKEKINLNFSCLEDWKLDEYKVEFLLNSNLTAIKTDPETNYETNFNSEGNSFSIMNNSKVKWEFYAYINELEDYKENLLQIKIPNDVNITKVYEPQYPTINRLQKCDNSTAGIFRVPINNISKSPNGYWKFEAVSPNYCEELTIYNNYTGIWKKNSSFNSADYINITAQIKNGLPYLDSTTAKLQIRYPNGSLWTTQTQLISPLTNGNLNFNIFKIPTNQPDYIAGQYKIIITWNNSHSNYGLNETGIIVGHFNVIHNSILKPEQSIYYVGEVIQNKTINLKCSYSDIDNSPIENSQVYIILKTQKNYFSEISPGFYFFELNTSKIELGYNSLQIFANSTFFKNQIINVSLNVVKESNLNIETELLSIAKGTNLHIEVEYRDKNGDHISGANISIYNDEIDDIFIENLAEERYEFTLLTQNLEIGINTFLIQTKSDTFTSQSDELKINIRRINTEITLKSGGSKLEYVVGEKAKIEVELEDLDFNEKILDAEVIYTWEFGEGKLEDKNNDGIYETELTDIPEGTYEITITVSAGDNYDFERFKIILNIKRPAEDLFYYQISIIIATLASIALGAYIIVYKKVLKYPKPVRKIHKYRDTLKKKKGPSNDIFKRNDVINQLYLEQLGVFSKELDNLKLNKKQELK